jgi:hypothetical protein
VLDLEKTVLETRNSPFHTAVYRSLIRPVQKLSFAATSRFYMEPSVKESLMRCYTLKKEFSKLEIIHPELLYAKA